MSPLYDDLLIDKLKSNAANKLSEDEKKLAEQLQAKLNLAQKQSRRYIEDLLKENATMPIRLKAVQVNNAESFRGNFLQSQIKPLTERNLVTLDDLSKRIDKVEENLRKLNVAENMLVSLNPIQRSIFARPSNTINIVPILNLAPVRRFYAKTGTNIGNGEGDGYIQFNLRNIFGGAENLILDAITGTRTLSSYLLNYNQPVFNHADFIWESTIYSNLKKFEWIKSQVQVKGFTTRIYTQYQLPFNHEVVFENSWRCLINKYSKSLEVFRSLGDDIKSSLAYNIKYDTRDNVHLPTTGHFFRMGIEYAGLFDFNTSNFVKCAFETQLAKTIIPSHTLISTVKSGIVYPFNNTNSLIDKFYTGGPNDVRSFNLNSLGPKSENCSIGGDMFLNGGISIVSRIPKTSKDSSFRLHNCLNWGNLIPLDKGNTFKESFRRLTSEFSIGYGFGLIYNHPMARFELNFVLPIAAHEGDGMRKGIQYGVGISFL